MRAELWGITDELSRYSSPVPAIFPSAPAGLAAVSCALWSREASKQRDTGLGACWPLLLLLS